MNRFNCKISKTNKRQILNFKNVNYNLLIMKFLRKAGMYHPRFGTCFRDFTPFMWDKTIKIFFGPSQKFKR